MPFDQEYESRDEYRRRRAWERRVKKKLLKVVTILVLLLAALIALVLLLLLRGRMAVMNEEFGQTASTSSFAMQFIGERTEAPTPTPEPTPEPVPEDVEPDYGEVPYISTEYMWSAKYSYSLQLRQPSFKCWTNGSKKFPVRTVSPEKR